MIRFGFAAVVVIVLFSLTLGRRWWGALPDSPPPSNLNLSWSPPHNFAHGFIFSPKNMPPG